MTIIILYYMQIFFSGFFLSGFGFFSSDAHSPEIRNAEIPKIKGKFLLHLA